MNCFIIRSILREEQTNHSSQIRLRDRVHSSELTPISKSDTFPGASSVIVSSGIADDHGPPKPALPQKSTMIGNRLPSEFSPSSFQISSFLS